MLEPFRPPKGWFLNSDLLADGIVICILPGVKTLGYQYFAPLVLFLKLHF